MTRSALDPTIARFVAQPRRIGARLMLVCFALLLVVLVLMLGLLFTDSWGRAGQRLDLVMEAYIVLQALLLAAALHAQLGAAAGPVAPLWQLWRQPALRDLPELPPLPRWKLALCYALPLLAAAGLLTMMAQTSARLERAWVPVQERYELEAMQGAGLAAPLIQLDCAAVPIPTTTESRCFILAPKAARPDPERFLRAWVDDMRSWVDWSGPEPVRREAPPLRLKLWQGGGFAGADQRVDLRVSRGDGPEEIPVDHRLLFVTRVGEQTGTVPAASEALTNWLGQQVFHTLLVVTPEE
ncbi:hypothetical protein [Deinococcus aquaedulcis]|uniref:hypothetical protein n=1 Tax=Deinococcus aquaedulcis TaxID=2840455 RepID=UPI001C82BB8E|nr:hypothetical protein [Deinococcus aquaedulcis]